MKSSRADTWSIGWSLALLAATFAIVLGTLLPFAALAAAVPGQPIVLCSIEGPRTIQAGGPTEHHPDHDGMSAECAACIVPLASALPPAPTAEPQADGLASAAPVRLRPAGDRHPPARAPPRPHSTAPPRT